MGITPEFLIYAVCLVGGTYSTYKIGIATGAQLAVEFLIEQGLLTIEDE